MRSAGRPGRWWRRRPAPVGAPGVGRRRAPLTGDPAPRIGGLSPTGDEIPPAEAEGVVLFMTSTCLACRQVWAALRAGESDGVGVVVVTPDPTLESAPEVAALGAGRGTQGGRTVVMSSDAWLAYRAGPSPWAVVVRDGVVVAEGTVAAWPEVAAMVATAGP